MLLGSGALGEVPVGATQSEALRLNLTVTESGSASTTQSEVLTLAVSVSEAGSSATIQSETLTLHVAITETGRARDTAREILHGGKRAAVLIALRII